MSIRKQIQRYRVHLSGSHKGEGSGVGRDRCMKVKRQTATYKTDKQQGYIIQHREIQPLLCNDIRWDISIRIVNNYVVHLELI